MTTRHIWRRIPTVTAITPTASPSGQTKLWMELLDWLTPRTPVSDTSEVRTFFRKFLSSWPFSTVLSNPAAVTKSFWLSSSEHDLSSLPVCSANCTALVGQFFSTVELETLWTHCHEAHKQSVRDSDSYLICVRCSIGIFWGQGRWNQFNQNGTPMDSKDCIHHCLRHTSWSQPAIDHLIMKDSQSTQPELWSVPRSL